LKFRWDETIPDPQSPDTFASAKLSWSWPEGSHHAGMRRLYQDLLAARRQWPALRDRRHTHARLAEHETAAPLLMIERGADAALVACANLGDSPQPLPRECAARNDRLLSTADPRYGGDRHDGAGDELLQPFELVIFGRGENPV
jgi:maltooligosyltrehalose trehalohydrolase